MNETVEVIEILEFDYKKILRIIDLLQRYYLPLLIVVGSMGNCLSVLVLLSTKLRRSSSSLYLAALALSDTGFLARTFITWLQHLNIFIANRQGVCQIITYFAFVFGSLSSWLVVAFTFERFVAVCYPLHRQIICTTKRAKILISLLSLMSLLLWTPWLWGSGPVYYYDLGYEMCSVIHEWAELLRVMNFIELASTFIVPFITIVALNTCISIAIWRANKLRKSQSRGEDSPAALRQLGVTKMLLVVSSAFLIFNLPEAIIRCYMSIKSDDHTDLEVIFVHLNNLLLITYFGTNFVLYCLSGGNFRSEAALFFHCRRSQQMQRKQKKKKPNLQQAHSSDPRTTKIAAASVNVNGTITTSCEPSTPRSKEVPKVQTSERKNDENESVMETVRHLEKILEGTSVNVEDV